VGGFAPKNFVVHLHQVWTVFEKKYFCDISVRAGAISHWATHVLLGSTRQKLMSQKMGHDLKISKCIFWGAKFIQFVAQKSQEMIF
jgi:hypothetical protein